MPQWRYLTVTLFVILRIAASQADTGNPLDGEPALAAASYFVMLLNR
jgi:hypothetical protein